MVIALACASPCPTCFCTAMGGGPAGTEGADLLAHDLPSLGRRPAAGGRDATKAGPCWKHTPTC